MPAQCPFLDRPYIAFSTRTPQTSVCQGDVIRLFDSTNGVTYGSCALGPFTPYTRARR